MVLLLGVGLPLILLGYLHGRSFRPPELTGSLADTGLGKVHLIGMWMLKQGRSRRMTGSDIK